MNPATASHARVNHPIPAVSVTTRAAATEARSSTPIADQGVLGFLSEQDLGDLMRWSPVRPLPRRAVVVRQGDPANSVMVVLDGFVKITTVLNDGREVVWEIVGPGGCFGELAVLNKLPHDAEATTLSPCRLLTIDARQFRHMLAQSSDGLLPIMRLVSERLRKRTERMVDTIVLSAPVRLAKLLVELSRLRSTSLYSGASVRLPLFQSELGAMAGLTRESVNRYLGLWRDAGWVVVSNGSVTVLDSQALSNLLPRAERGQF